MLNNKKVNTYLTSLMAAAPKASPLLLPQSTLGNAGHRERSESASGLLRSRLGKVGGARTTSGGFNRSRSDAF